MRGRKLAAALAAAGLVAGLWAAPASAGQSGEVVATDNGRVHGTSTAQYREFQGIPFAAPPVGPLRWASPQPAQPWKGHRDATKPGNRCAQNAGLLGEEVSFDEDCLYLNVTTPRRAHNLPVMVWVHGGGYRNGAGSLYQPAEMVVRGDVVVVTVNYRLGVFGFLGHPSFPQSGNYGLEDQQAALRWVQRNAAAFGGDPGNVTVFGESAGGVSTCAQLASPAATGLFQRAVVQSGPCTMGIWPNVDGTPDPTGTWLPRTAAAAENQGLKVASTLGCPDPATAVDCLRDKKTAEILPQSDFGFGPVYGRDLLPLSPAEAVASGKFNRVPVMHGMTRDEYRMFTGALELLGMPPLTDYPSLVKAFVGEDKAAAVLQRYPQRDYGSPSEAWSAAVTDAVFARSVSDMSQQLSRYVPTYAFEFADANAPWVQNLGQFSFPTGAYHASELQYLFDLDYFTDDALNPAQRRLSRTMIDYWTRFARTGDPNGPGTPRWQRTTGSHAQSLNTGPDGVRPMDFSRAHQSGFWRGL